MEILIGIVGIVVAILLWLFPPEPLRDLFRLSSQREDESGSVHFFIRLGEQSIHYWCSVDAPLKTNIISSFQEHCSQFFQIDTSKFVDDIDPSFDITFLSELDSTVILHDLGVEIVSIAHELKLYGTPQATRIVQQASYIIEVPNIRAYIANELGRFPRVLEPQNINLFLTSKHQPDLFRLEPQSTFRYELLLRNYVAHMPNYAVLRFWIMTQKGKYTSEAIHVFTV